MSTKDLHGESELINYFQQGSHKALHEVYAIYQRPLCFFTEQLVSDTMAAEDIVSDCFISAYQKKEHFPSLGHLKSFLFTAAKNAALNYIKSQKRHSDIHLFLESNADKFSIDVESAYIRTEVLQTILMEIGKLPNQCQQVVRLAIIDGKSAQEIATELNIAYQTVLNQKAKGIALLRNTLLKNELISLPVLVLALMALRQ